MISSKITNEEILTFIFICLVCPAVVWYLKQRENDIKVEVQWLEH